MRGGSPHCPDRGVCSTECYPVHPRHLWGLGEAVFFTSLRSICEAFLGRVGAGWILAHWSSHGLGCTVCLQGLTSGESSHHKFTTSGCFTQSLWGSPFLGVVSSVHKATELSNTVHTSMVQSCYNICGHIIFTSGSHSLWMVESLPWGTPTIHDCVSQKLWDWIIQLSQGRILPLTGNFSLSMLSCLLPTVGISRLTLSTGYAAHFC